jgi:hypothetical protein
MTTKQYSCWNINVGTRKEIQRKYQFAAIPNERQPALSGITTALHALEMAGVLLSQTL